MHLRDWQGSDLCDKTFFRLLPSINQWIKKELKHILETEKYLLKKELIIVIYITERSSYIESDKKMKLLL